MDSVVLKDKIVALLEDKKGNNIEVLEVDTASSIAQYFVIAQGNTKIQVRALANNVEDSLEKECELRPIHVDGRESGGWLVLDYGAVIVHVFDPETYEVFQLKTLWADERNAKVIK